MPVPVGHFHLAAGQADNRSRANRARGGNGQILNESVKALGALAMPVDKVQYLVEKQQDGRVRGGEHSPQCFGPRRDGLSCSPERGHTLVASQLAREVNPGRLASFRRIPGIADKDPDPGLRCTENPRLHKQIGHAGQTIGFAARLGKMVERGQRVRLPATKLGDQRKHRGCLLRFA